MGEKVGSAELIDEIKNALGFDYRSTPRPKMTFTRSGPGGKIIEKTVF